MIESFADRISTWIVWCGCRLLYVIHGVQLCNYGIFKTSALVAVNTGQDAIHIEPFLYQYLGNGKCLLVVSNEGLTELGESISQYQDVLLTVPWWVNFQKINTQQVQGIIGNKRPLLCMWTCVMTLCNMAPMAIGDIFSCIMVHGTPMKSLSHKSQSPVQSLMTIVIMQHMKDSLMIF